MSVYCYLTLYLWFLVCICEHIYTTQHKAFAGETNNLTNKQTILKFNHGNPRNNPTHVILFSFFDRNGLRFHNFSCKQLHGVCVGVCRLLPTAGSHACHHSVPSITISNIFKQTYGVAILVSHTITVGERYFFYFL